MSEVKTEAEPWPSQGIRTNTNIEDYTWGYLTIDENGVPHFDESTRPSDKEIMNRWKVYLKGNAKED